MSGCALTLRSFLCALAAVLGLSFDAAANPLNPSVPQGTANFTSSGPQLTIRTSDRAFINWQSFNIGIGETTTFVQPSSSSLVWNRITDGNPSQILGNLNANGYVILQNQAGFFIGGQASITTHGLMMTTAPMPMADLTSQNPWSFNALPPTASIINYGQINLSPGGSAFLIAHAVENHGTISAPDGNIGLYAGKEVLVSERPDGRGLSAKLTLPEGSVDNSGTLTADAGIIAMHAQVVNQGGLVQANSVREANGVVELVAADTLNLGPASVIEAKGDSTGTSPGGFVVLKSDQSFADTTTSTINVAGGTAGGPNGVVEVFGQDVTPNTIKSTIDNHSASDFASQGILLVNPSDITLSYDPTDKSSSSPNFNVDDLSAYTKVALFADHDITLNASWILADSTDEHAGLWLNAKRNITLSDGNAIIAGRNWSVDLTAGTELTSAAERRDGSDGIYLQGSGFIRGLNGDIELSAENEILVDDGFSSGLTVEGNGVTTTGGGSITAHATYGNVNTGRNPAGYEFGRSAAPYYRVSSSLGGISTAAGGNVTISAGGDVISYLPLAGDVSAGFDGGSGAFGPQHGDVSITAGENVYGHYVLANGTGRITAQNGNVGGDSTTPARQGFALSLVRGDWNVSAPNGSIYIQEARNPNGVLNNSGNAFSNPGFHLFDYDLSASVRLDAGETVEITGRSLPRTADPVRILFPPILQVAAGRGSPVVDPTHQGADGNPGILGYGGFVMRSDVALFPSPEAHLDITTIDGGDFLGVPNVSGVFPILNMSDSGRKRWTIPSDFGPDDHRSQRDTVNDTTPVNISVSGSVKDVTIATVKATHITVGGDMINSSFVGENLNSGDVTSINVTGQIFNQPFYTFSDQLQTIVSVDPRDPMWDSVLRLIVDPTKVAATTIPSDLTPGELKQRAALLALYADPAGTINNPGFVYNTTTMRFGFGGRMAAKVLQDFTQPLKIIRIGLDGVPVVEDGHFVLDPVSFVTPEVIQDLFARSQEIARSPLNGFRIGGPGQFNITANSMELGSSDGIQSWGIGGGYRSLSDLTTEGAAINVTLAGDLSMFTSRIASFFGGDVTVISTGGRLNLGSQELFGSSSSAFGIYTSGHSDVEVIAYKDIDINGSRIAAFNGGNVHVKSLDGSVNAGSGGNTLVNVPLVFGSPPPDEASADIVAPIYGSGIVTTSLIKKYQTPGGNPLPGNITVETPHGDIVSETAGILQLALDGNISGGPIITLVAGTPATPGVPAFSGNIDLGDSGLIGGTVNATAEGNIRGLIVSRQSATIQAAQNFSGTLLSAGNANVSAGGSVSGTIVGIGGVSASGGSITASLLSQNVSVGGGQSQSTLGSTATATTTSQAAAQQASTDAKPKEVQSDSDDDEEKKKANRPVLTRRIGRVTVILPKA